MLKYFEKIKNYIAPILTALAVVALGFFVFSVFKIEVNWKDGETIARILVGVALQGLMIGLWLPEGKRFGEKNEGYIANNTLANKRILAVSQPDLYTPLEQFCAFATKENIDFAINRKLQKMGINYELYKSNDDYAGRFDEKTKRKIEKIIAFCERTARPIKATEITTCSNIKDKYDVRNHEKTYATGKLLFKGVVSIFSAFVGACLLWQKTNNVKEAIFLFLYWLLVMGSAVFFAIRTGINLVVDTRNDYLMRLIDFFNRFDAWREKQQ